MFFVPVKVSSGMISFFSVSSDSVVLFDNGEEVFDAVFLHTPNDKIIDYEWKDNGETLV